MLPHRRRSTASHPPPGNGSRLSRAARGEGGAEPDGAAKGPEGGEGLVGWAVGGRRD